MSDELGQVLSMTRMSSVWRLGEGIVPTGVFDKGVETYNLFAILEDTVAGLEVKATRLMVSRNSDSIYLGPKGSK